MHIIAPHISCVVNAPIGDNAVGSDFDIAVSQGYSEIYVVGPSGIVKYHKLRGENRYVTVKVDKIPGKVAIHELSEDFSGFLPAGPVPLNLLRQIESFFRQVMSNHNDALEAMIWVLYNPEQGYFLHVPEQRISKASVSYDWDSVPSGSSIVVDIH